MFFLVQYLKHYFVAMVPYKKLYDSFSNLMSLAQNYRFLSYRYSPIACDKQYFMIEKILLVFYLLDVVLGTSGLIMLSDQGDTFLVCISS